MIEFMDASGLDTTLTLDLSDGVLACFTTDGWSSSSPVSVTRTQAIQLAEELLNWANDASVLPKLPRDRNGREIRAGDVIRMQFHVRRRQFPGRVRAAIQSLSGQEVVVSDEGAYLPPTVQWVEFKVRWDGACLVAERVKESDTQAIASGSCTSVQDGRPVDGKSAVRFLGASFCGSDFEIVSPRASV